MKNYKQIEIGDYIVAKSTYTMKNVPFKNPNHKYISTLEIKAIGIVTSNPLDGHNLGVNWITDYSNQTERKRIYNRSYLNIISNPFKYGQSDSIDEMLDYIFKDKEISYQDLAPSTSTNVSVEDLEIFTEYINQFLQTCKDSIGNEVMVKNSVLPNYVPNATLPRTPIFDSKLILRRTYARFSNTLLALPYISIDWLNLYYDWDRKIFDQPTLFIASTKINDGPNLIGNVSGLNFNSYFSSWELSDTKLNLKDTEDYKHLLTDFYDIYHNYFTNEKGDPTLMKFVNALKQSKNIILHGAPGTGKSYLANEIARKLISENDDNFNEEHQIKFVQFHPSYDYTDFVEGLRPFFSENSQVGFRLEPGSFMKFCDMARIVGNVTTGDKTNFDQAWEDLIEYITHEKSIEIPLISKKGNLELGLSSVNSLKVLSAQAGTITKDNLLNVSKEDPVNRATHFKHTCKLF